MAKLKFNPPGYQDLGAYALLKNVVENGHLVAEDPTPPPPAKYKVYTALLTQNGGNDPFSMDTGTLTVGVTYYIANISAGMDFTNVGAPNNNVDTYFVATGTTPNSWGENEGLGNSTLQYDNGAPVANVLENTIGNIWFEYIATGEYFLKTNENLIPSSTISNKIVAIGYETNTGVSTSIWVLNIIDEGESNYRIISTAKLNITDNTSTNENNLLQNTLIEIRVYG